MCRFAFLAAAALLLAGCEGGGKTAQPAAADGDNDTARPQAPPAPAPVGTAPPPASAAAVRWTLQASGEGSALLVLSSGGKPVLRVSCAAGGKQLLVNVPAFRPVGSEERLSLGSGGAVTALVADSRGDRLRGGVTATGAVPAELSELLAGAVAVTYGAQTSGPHAKPPAELASAFAAACRRGADPASAAETAAGNPCHVQGAEQLSATPLRAVGTEPFWAARIEGRCVTYSHPEDQGGTRIWTRFVAAAGGGGTWSGAHAGRRFELRLRPAPGCSDGMSDRAYPLAAELVVGGERRQGCAAPL